MTFPDGTVVIVNCPFQFDKLWFLICWAKLTIDGQSTVLIMRDFSFRYMLTLLPEAMYVVRSTHGEKQAFYGWTEKCSAKTVAVFFLRADHISFLDRKVDLPEIQANITDSGYHHRIEIYARLRHENAEYEQIVKELGTPTLDK